MLGGTPPECRGGSEEGAEEFFLAERIFGGGDGGEQGILAGVSLAVTQELCSCLGHLDQGKTGSGTPKTTPGIPQNTAGIPKMNLEFIKTPLKFLNPSLNSNLYPKSTPKTPNSTLKS